MGVRGSSGSWATGSPRGSPTSATPATGGRDGRAGRRPTTGRSTAIARNRIDLGKIIVARPDALRVAGTLITHQVRAYDVLRMLGRDGHPPSLGQAFAEYGRIAKTLHLPGMIAPRGRCAPPHGQHPDHGP